MFLEFNKTLQFSTLIYYHMPTCFDYSLNTKKIILEQCRPSIRFCKHNKGSPVTWSAVFQDCRNPLYVSNQLMIGTITFFIMCEYEHLFFPQSAAPGVQVIVSIFSTNKKEPSTRKALYLSHIQPCFTFMCLYRNQTLSLTGA